MNTQRFIISGIAGGVTAFLLGYLFYGLLLADFFTQHVGAAGNTMRSMDAMVWWSLILGNLFYGLLISYIFNMWASIDTLSTGAFAGAVILFLMSAAVDFSIYGTSTIASLTGTVADIAVSTVIGSITGAAVGLVNRFGKKGS